MPESEREALAHIPEHLRSYIYNIPTIPACEELGSLLGYTIVRTEDAACTTVDIKSDQLNRDMLPTERYTVTQDGPYMVVVDTLKVEIVATFSLAL